MDLVAPFAVVAERPEPPRPPVRARAFTAFALRIARAMALERIEDIRTTRGKVVVVTQDGRRMTRILRFPTVGEAAACAARFSERYGGVVGRYAVAGCDSWGFVVHPEGMGEYTFEVG